MAKQKHLYKRCDNHLNNINNNEVEASALAKHSLQNYHEFQYENVKSTRQ